MGGLTDEEGLADLGADFGRRVRAVPLAISDVEDGSRPQPTIAVRKATIAKRLLDARIRPMTVRIIVISRLGSINNQSQKRFRHSSGCSEPGKRRSGRSYP
jgi:hypothetical protein